MKRALIGLAAVLGLLVGVAAGQFGGMGRTMPQAQAWNDKEPPWWVSINVMEVDPEQFAVGVGDWVELYATTPAAPNTLGQPYKVEIAIEGDAVEKIAAVRPARFLPIQPFGRNPDKHPIMMPYATTQAAIVSERHIFVRGKHAGKATIKTTVTRSETWKETRQFEVTVAEQREVPPEPRGPGGFQ